MPSKHDASSIAFGWFADRAWLFALGVAALAGVLLITNVSSASAHARTHHATKTLDAHVRSSTRQTAHHTPVVVARPVVHPRRTHARHR